MKRVIAAAFVAAWAGAVAAADRGNGIDVAALDRLTARFELCRKVGTPGTDDFRFVYTNSQGRIFVYREEEGHLQSDWENTELGSRAAAMTVTDLYGDGGRKIVVGTVRGRILVWDLATYDLEWENLQDRFEKIAYLTAANIDDDPQQELLVLGDDRLVVFDGVRHNIEWRSETPYVARLFVVGNVDDDPQSEIIFNTGRVVDSRFFNVEFEADGSFGDRIELMDLNGDGYPEVFGEFSDFSIRVYDVWAQRELW